MQTRQLGRTDLHLTTVGLGTWAIGGPWKFGWGPQDDDQSIRTIHRALDLGINWIDTAPAYGLGHSEEIVGRVLADRTDRPIVATKCGIRWDDRASGQAYRHIKADSIRKEVDDSLRRLGVDVIDLYQIHWPDPDSDVEEAWTEVARLAEIGKVRYPAVSNFSVDQLERARRIHPVASLQPPYSMLRRDVEDDILPYCAEHDIGVVVYSPMQAGLLTGKYTAEKVADLPAGDWRLNNHLFQQPRLDENLALVDRLRPIAERNGRSLAELAIAWVLRLPVVTAAIVGARRPDQIETTAPAGDWTLSDEDVAEIEALLAEHEAAVADL